MSSIDQEIQDYFKRYGHYGYDPRRENIDRLRAVVAEATLDFDLLDFDPSKLPDTMDVESWYQIENQGMVGQCAGEARCGCQELAYYYQTKGDIIQLNRHYAYRTAQEHDGIRGDSGSTVEGNAIVAHEQGTPREELWPYQGRYTSIPSDLRPALKADALNYRIESWKILRSYDEVYAWLARRIGGVDIGIIWNNSCQTDGDGTMSNYRGWGGGGHSVALLDWTKKKLDRKGRAHIRLANSHTRRYGKNGWADVPPDTVTEWCKSHTVIGFSDMMNIRPREYDWAKGKHIV